jgi:hypothetical protein
MISFRFHIVSITAVFLAIAIGVLVGTTYVDRAVVENLENRIDTVSGNLDERRAQIAALEGELDELRRYAAASAEFAVTDRLLDVPVLFLAVRGVGEGPAEELATLLRRAGARTPGVVWLEPGWSLDDEESRSRLAAVLGAGAPRTAAALAAEVFAALAAALVAPDGPEAPPADPAVLQALLDSGFISVDDLGDPSVGLVDLAGSSPRVLVLTGTEAGEGLAQMVPAFLERMVDGGLAAVVADVYVHAEEGERRGEALWAALPEDLRDRLVVVDAADRPEGRVAAVVGLGEAAAGRPGRYGLGPGADAVLPVWAAP